MAGGKGTIGLSGKAALLEGGREDFKGQSAYTAGRAFDQIIYQSQRDHAGEEWMRAGRMMAGAVDKAATAFVEWKQNEQQIKDVEAAGKVHEILIKAHEAQKAEEVNNRGAAAEGFVDRVTNSLVGTQAEIDQHLEGIQDKKLAARLRQDIAASISRMKIDAIGFQATETGHVLKQRFEAAGKDMIAEIRRNPDMLADPVLMAQSPTVRKYEDLKGLYVTKLGASQEAIDTMDRLHQDEMWAVGLKATLDRAATVATPGDNWKAYGAAVKDAEARFQGKVPKDVFEQEIATHTRAARAMQDRAEAKAKEARNTAMQTIGIQQQTAKESYTRLLSGLSPMVTPFSSPQDFERYTGSIQAALREYDDATRAKIRIEGTMLGKAGKAEERLKNHEADMVQYRDKMQGRIDAARRDYGF